VVVGVPPVPAQGATQATEARLERRTLAVPARPIRIEWTAVDDVQPQRRVRSRPVLEHRLDRVDPAGCAAHHRSAACAAAGGPGTSASCPSTVRRDAVADQNGPHVRIRVDEEVYGRRLYAQRVADLDAVVQVARREAWLEPGMIGRRSHPPDRHPGGRWVGTIGQRFAARDRAPACSPVGSGAGHVEREGRELAWLERGQGSAVHRLQVERAWPGPSRVVQRLPSARRISHRRCYATGTTRTSVDATGRSALRDRARAGIASRGRWRAAKSAHSPPAAIRISIAPGQSSLHSHGVGLAAGKAMGPAALADLG
jgi:hypothetical protein